MSREKKQKVKILRLYDILRRYSTYESPLTTPAIMKYMADEDISCDRRTVYSDIEALREFGFDIEVRRLGNANAYYLHQETFQTAELRLLTDAVQAANFIPDDQTRQLCEHIARLGNQQQRDELAQNKVVFNTRKHSNEQIYQNIDILDTAIRESRQVSFCYFDLNEHKKRVYRKHRKRFITDPLALIYIQDNYYLIAYSRKYAANTTYRLDRMDSILIEDTPSTRRGRLRSRDTDFAAYTKKVFHMYGGEEVRCTLRFTRDVLGAIYDQFGEHIRPTRVRTQEMTSPADLLEVTAPIQVSPTFYGWIFQFGGKVEIVAPEKVREEFRERCKSMADRLA